MNSKLYITFKWIFVTVVTLTVFYPIFMVINTSFKPISELFASPFSLVKDIQFENYINAWSKGNIGIYLRNSFIVTTTSVFFIVLFSSMAAFAISRRETFKKFDKFIYIFFLLGNIIPPQVAIIPIYIQLMKLNILDSFLGLCIVFIAFGVPFGVFILYWSFSNVPLEIIDSAKIDGASNLDIYLKIIIPIARHSITTVIIFTGVWIWNYFLFPLVLLLSTSKKTLPIGLFAFKGRFSADYPSMFAGVVMISLPMIIIFLILQKQFMEGITTGAVKG